VRELIPFEAFVLVRVKPK